MSGRGWRAAAALVSTAAAVLLAEAALRLFWPVPDPYGADVLRRRVNLYVPDGYEPVSATLRPDPRLLPGCVPPVRFTVTEWRFRAARLASVSKQAEEVRVFCLGGSTTTCMYLDDDRTWPAVLGRRLAAAAPSRTVVTVNAGVDGSTTRDHVATLAQRIVPLSPDVVIVMAGWNEALTPAMSGYDVLRRDRRSYCEVSLDDPGLGYHLRRTLAGASQLFRRLVWERRQGRSVADERSPAEDPEGRWIDLKRRTWRTLPNGPGPQDVPTEEYRQNLVTLVAVSRAHGAVPVLVTQATAWGRGGDEAVGRLAWALRFGGSRIEGVEAVRTVERVNEVTRRVARDTNTPLIDLFSALRGGPELFYDDCHFNIAGARAAGEALGEGLLSIPGVLSLLTGVP